MSHGSPRSSYDSRQPRPTPPRRVRGGVRFRVDPAALEGHWLAGPLIRIMQRDMPAEIVQQGLDYAVQGQMVAMTITEGGVAAEVQDHRRLPQRCTVALSTFDDHTWDIITDEMGEQAIYSARLLEGTWPDGAEAVLAERGVEFFREEESLPTIVCNCDQGQPCWHLATTIWLLAARLYEHPIEIFALRGRALPTMLERLRQQRAIRMRGMASAHHDPYLASDVATPAELSTLMDHFWSAPQESGTGETGETTGYPPHALLRRMGPPPLATRFPIVGLLASVYDEVATAARRIRDAADPGELTDLLSLTEADRAEESIDHEDTSGSVDAPA